MSDTEVVLDKSLTANGTDETSEFDVRNIDRVALQVDGDSNATNISITAFSKVRDVGTDSFSELDSTVNSEDISTTNNNSKTYTYDVENVVNLKWEFDEGAGNTPSITAIASREV